MVFRDHHTVEFSLNIPAGIPPRGSPNVHTNFFNPIFHDTPPTPVPLPGPGKPAMVMRTTRQQLQLRPSTGGTCCRQRLEDRVLCFVFCVLSLDRVCIFTGQTSRRSQTGPRCNQVLLSLATPHSCFQKQN